MSDTSTPLPDTLQEHDCPVCFETDSLRDRVPICPNGHRLCAECQPRIQGTLRPQCPLCRARLPDLQGRLGPLPVQDFQRDFPVIAQPPPVARRVVDHAEREVRRQRANAAFNDVPRRREAQQLFLQNRQTGRIPETARFGGFHERNCPCGRHGGAEGVRFLKLRNNTRRYRCEVCYRIEMGEDPPAPPDWNLPAVAMHNDVVI